MMHPLWYMKPGVCFIAMDLMARGNIQNSVYFLGIRSSILKKLIHQLLRIFDSSLQILSVTRKNMINFFSNP